MLPIRIFNEGAESVTIGNDVPAAEVTISQQLLLALLICAAEEDMALLALPDEAWDCLTEPGREWLEDFLDDRS